ncbi:hypothetical protein GCM10010124_27050 [Pilimelia terevasa]|uniref:Cell envelope-related transcriptional attenuator domain-containing protein n=1 Tax=Pilimelia terevasa TaxID=53372 RepID=A0A8J3FL88_9ACTN|nr:LCP family protein [Pilimelia terevasa]GGK32861.1 hypothetical protein GCM10010124_27050 [Pilimelia terevasa]
MGVQTPLGEPHADAPGPRPAGTTYTTGAVPRPAGTPPAAAHPAPVAAAVPAPAANANATATVLAGAHVPADATATANGTAPVTAAAATTAPAAVPAPAPPADRAPAGFPAPPAADPASTGDAPPAAPGAGTRRRAPLWARLCAGFGATLMIVSGGALAASAFLERRYTGAVNQANLLSGGATAAAGTDLAGPVNMLLLGVDERSDNKGDMRSDSIIILHIPASHDQAYLVSVPRDSYVPIPASRRSGFGGGMDKITEAFYFGSRNGAGREGGAQLVGETLHQLTGITFNGAAIIDFGGFKRVIDALGGVTMCVDHAVSSIHMKYVDGQPRWNSEPGEGPPVRHRRGCKKMAGWEALDFSRQRYGLPNGDYDRQRHQQQLVKGIAREAMATGAGRDLRRLDGLVRAAGRALTVDTGAVPVADFAFTLRGIAARDLVMVRTNAGTFNSDQVGETSVEKLSDESLGMMHAIRDGDLAGWLVGHPHFISTAR